VDFLGLVSDKHTNTNCGIDFSRAYWFALSRSLQWSYRKIQWRKTEAFSLLEGTQSCNYVERLFSNVNLD
jgi:hypothetical protein